jgi:hypothetical protein
MDYGLCTMYYVLCTMDLDKGTLICQTPVYSKKVSLTKKIGIAAQFHQNNHGVLTKFTLGFNLLNLRISGGFGYFYPRFNHIIPEVYIRIP